MQKNLQYKTYIFFLVIFFNFLNLSSLYAQTKEDCSNTLYISKLTFSGNKTTKEQVILREIRFSEGDSVCKDALPKLILESKQNLEKLPLFNFVNIKTDTLSDNSLHIHIEVVERWYFIPLFNVTYADRNLNAWLKEKDWTRIKLSAGFEKYNFRGHNENIGAYGVYGYDKQISLFYKNIYFDDARKNGASLFFKIYKRNETPYIIENDKYTQLKLQGDFVMNAHEISGEYFHRVQPGEQHTLGLAYNFRTVSDTILTLNPNYYTSPNLKSEYVYLRYIFDKDVRDSRTFPMSGYRFRFFAQHTGLVFFPKSNISFLLIRPQVSNYHRFGKKFSLGNQLVLKKSFGGEQPFYLKDALGTEFNIRGYEYYVVYGEDFALCNNNLNFELLPKTVFTIPYIPFEKFSKVHLTIYLGAFVDIAYVKNSDITFNQTNTLTNIALYSGGFSLNFLSYYDKLLRFDFSVNHLGEKHFFFHISAPF